LIEFIGDSGHGKMFKKTAKYRFNFTSAAYSSVMAFDRCSRFYLPIATTRENSPAGTCTFRK
jgi:hypothetical protein